MRNRKLLPALAGATIAGAIVVYVAFYFVFLDFFVDLWWFRSLEFEAYFWLRLLYRFIFSGAVTLFFFSIFQFHFWIASRYLGLNPPDEVWLDDKKRRRFQRFADVFFYGSAKVYTPVSFLLGIVVAIPFYLQWEDALLFFFGSASGIKDPVYDNDISFYLFSYPIYMLIQKELLATALIGFIATYILYWLEHTFIPNQGREFPFGAKIHLTVLFVFVVFFVAWGFMLDRFSLLYSSGREPVFFGPGFVDLRYRLPLIWMSALAFLTIAGLVVFYVFSEQHRSKTSIVIAVLSFMALLGLKNSTFLPGVIEKFIVKPNPTRTEGPFIQYNIDATMAAYDLNNIDTVDLPINVDATKDIEQWATQKNFENIPVWDREYLIDSYKQLQTIRPYYTFPTVDEDRYFIRGHYQQVNLAAREANVANLSPEAQNWENTHLRYTHGFGAVVSPAAQDADIPIVWYLRDLNLSSNAGFSVKFPDMYYGLEKYQYAIVPNKLVTQNISGSDPEMARDYFGKSGVPIPSYFRKLLFAFYFKDEKIFFSPNISTDSKLLIRRNIVERIATLTPFLHLDKDPYLVIDKDRFFWVQDAYTLSNLYPVAKPAADDFLDGAQKFNYIRNSVKVVVDAYTGNVDYYICDPDPIIAAYSRAYPGVFKHLSDMPANLKAHLRYPRDLYYMQMKIFAKYHQNTPESFYEQAETWQYAMVGGEPVLPYFITMNFERCNGLEEFAMINPMTPFNSNNLSMVGIAGTIDHKLCDPYSYKPGITIFKFPKDVQVNGPSQVNALIDQNPDIAAQFTLWNQLGSEVKKGRMVILPMGNSILYVQPIYMLATKTKMPELARVIVSIGNQVVMDKTLATAFNRLKALFIKDAASPASGISVDTGK
ncbi:MAG: UPF0182 family protein [Methylomonas sp.]|nr:UPF0182 family protein [Methylomonas sp.]